MEFEGHKAGTMEITTTETTLIVRMGSTYHVKYHACSGLVILQCTR